MNKAKYLLIVTSFVLLFSACGGSGGGGSSDKRVEQKSSVVEQKDTKDTNLGLNYLSEPLLNQQWSIFKNKEFYAQNSIDDNAHINPRDNLSLYEGKGIKIAVLDDNFDTNHQDLANAKIESFNIVTGTSDVFANTQESHGTAVAGIIGARVNGIGIKGIASSSELILISMPDEMSTSDYIIAFDKAAKLGADIINCSWGTNMVSIAVEEKIKELATTGRGGKGISIVFASGNDNIDILGDESNIKEVISVGATDSRNVRASYSNYGTNLDVLAPGGESLGITTIDKSGSEGISLTDYLLYDDESPFIGTSASAPIVSGLIALMLEKNPNLTRIEIENIIKNTADKIGYIPYIQGRNDYYGYGKINLDSIMQNITALKK